MKVFKANYLDDSVSVSGVLIKRFLRRPVFYAFDEGCGWHYQVITKQNKAAVVIMLGGCGSGKARCFDVVQRSEKMYCDAIKATVDSGKANEILRANGEKEI